MTPFKAMFEVKVFEAQRYLEIEAAKDEPHILAEQLLHVQKMFILTSNRSGTRATEEYNSTVSK